jgi:hypothetical protein
MMQGHRDTTNITSVDPDAVDFVSFFAKQDAYNIRILSALRMNATFPIVLPNVWLPSNPVIDVMDAGLRDNFGQETSLRFLSSFDEWIKENTSGVLLIQMRDRGTGGWEMPYVSDDISDHITKPFLLLQHNWFKMMEFFQNDMLNYYSTNSRNPVYKITFQYTADSTQNRAALNFHLTKREEKDIMSSINSAGNQKSFRKVMTLFERKISPDSIRGNIPRPW